MNYELDQKVQALLTQSEDYRKQHADVIRSMLNSGSALSQDDKTSVITAIAESFAKHNKKGRKGLLGTRQERVADYAAEMHQAIGIDDKAIKGMLSILGAVLGFPTGPVDLTPSQNAYQQAATQSYKQKDNAGLVGFVDSALQELEQKRPRQQTQGSGHNNNDYIKEMEELLHKAFPSDAEARSRMWSKIHSLVPGSKQGQTFRNYIEKIAKNNENSQKKVNEQKRVGHARSLANA